MILLVVALLLAILGCVAAVASPPEWLKLSVLLIGGAVIVLVIKQF